MATYSRTKSKRVEITSNNIRLQKTLKSLEKQTGELQASMYVYKEQLRMESTVASALRKDLASARDQLNRLVHEQLLIQPDSAEPIQMDVYDLLLGFSETGTVIATIGLQDLVSRHRDELDSVFAFYKSINDTQYAIDAINRMTGDEEHIIEEEYNFQEEEKKASIDGIALDQFFSFVIDCKFISRQITKDIIRDIFIKSMHHSVMEDKVNGKLTYNQFVESIVRLANVRYPQLQNVAASTALLLTTKVLPNARKKANDSIRGKIGSMDIQNSLVEFKTSLFNSFGAISDSFIGNEPTISFPATLQSMIDCRILDTNLTNAKIHRCFVESIREKGPEKKTPRDARATIDFYEWCENSIQNILAHNCEKKQT